jgi:tetratricopeptide (TPR) repeat protein
LSLKLIKIEPRLARVVLIAAAAACVVVTWYFVKWNFVNTIAYRVDPRVPGIERVADWLTDASPGDPQTHLTAALVYERTLEPKDLAHALSEYETAAALAPHDYTRWLDLGKARAFSGDDEGARQAYARALELAPNYSSVQWAYGNFLIRSGDVEKGFELIGTAAAANGEYARPAVTTASQILDGDASRVRVALGDNENINAALALMLASSGRFDEAADAWTRLPADAKTSKLRSLGSALIDQMTAAKKFRAAARIAADLEPNENEKPVIGQVQNGGFESGVKPRNAPLFQWQITDGAHPQIGLAQGQTHGGVNALFMLFNTFETAAFRDISQTVAVEPGAEYELELYYRSDLKTPAALRWDVADAATGQPLTDTPVIAAVSEWTPLKARFRVPADSDGITIRLVRSGCAGPACQMTGKLMFDDVSLRRL